MGGDKSLARLFSFSDVAYHTWSYVDIQSLHKLMSASTQYVSDRHFETLSALVKERYDLSLVDIPGEVVDSKRLQTIKAEIKRVLWYQDIEDLFALLFTTKHRINTSKSLKGLFSLDLSDRITCKTLLHVACQYGFANGVSLILSFAESIPYGISTLWSQCHCSAYPVDNAVRWGHINVLQVLLKYNCDISGPIRGGLRPIHSLVQNGFDIRSLLPLLPRSSLDIPCLNHILGRESYLWFI